MVGRAEDLNLDGYMIFLENRAHGDLPNRLLNQIISMHGFKKLHKVPKKIIVDALSSIDLAMPFRSTVMESVSSMVSPTKDEVVTDLAALAWQECALQRIETLTSSINNISPDSDLIVRPSSGNCIAVGGSVKRRRTCNNNNNNNYSSNNNNNLGLEPLLLPYWPTM